MQLTIYLAVAALSVLGFTAVLLALERRNHANLYLLGFVLVMGCFSLARLDFLLRGPFTVALAWGILAGGFLAGPLLYLYTGALLFGRRLTWKSGALLSIAPVVALAIHVGMSIKHPELMDGNGIQSMDGAVPLAFRMNLCAAVPYSVGFMLAALRLVAQYRVAYMDNYSSTDRGRIGWLVSLLVVNLVGPMAHLSVTLTALDSREPFTPVEGFGILLFVYLLAFYFVKKPEVFAITDESDMRAVPATVSAQGPKYARQSLNEEKRKEYLHLIEQYFRDAKPFLNETVTLHDIAEAMNIPAHHVSMAINIERQMNFYSFVSFFRIEEAKKLLSNPDLAGENILQVAFRAGFQSKSVFNRIFKQMTGRTPREYRSSAAAKHSVGPHDG